MNFRFSFNMPYDIYKRRCDMIMARSFFRLRYLKFYKTLEVVR